MINDKADEDTTGSTPCKIDLFFHKYDHDWSKAIHQQYNIRRRTCTTFIRQKSSAKDNTASPDDGHCGCHRRRRDHSWDVLDGDESAWDAKKHTREACTNAYGYVPKSGAHYLRCDIETDLDKLCQFVLKVWKIQQPRLIMCIIGGAKYFKLNERLEREFIKGIIQAALKADGWIFSSGFKTGVVKLVGEAIHDHRVTNPRSHITAIGFPKWGATKTRDALRLRKLSEKKSTDENPSKNKPTAEKGQQVLEPNHTHYLLVDDGLCHGYDIGDFRTRFARAVSSYQNLDVPIVTIVVEGGPDTLSAIYNDLCVDTPIVLIDGSGRVTDLLAQYLTRTATVVSQNEKQQVHQVNWELPIGIKDTKKLRELFDPYLAEMRVGLKSISKGSKTSEKEMDELLDYFLYCLQPAVRKKIHTFSLDGDCDLDDTIFQAIIQAKQKTRNSVNTGLNREQLLELALAWDALGVAKEYIIKDDVNDLEPESRKRLFVKALLLDRPQFVNTFIKLNFDLPQMFYKQSAKTQRWELDWNQLQDLYKDSDKDRKERLCLLGKCLGRAEIKDEHELDQLLRELIGDYMEPIYAPSTHQPKHPRRHSARVSDSQAYLYTNEMDRVSVDIPDPEEAHKEVEELVYRDLFLWSILTNRIEMSKVLLGHMQTRVCAALVASKIFKSYLSYASDNESKDILLSQADQFETYANECLKCCYNYDEEKACEIAIRRIQIFGGMSCLQIAVDADDKTFVGQPCCDQLLTNIWHDKIQPIQSTGSKRARLLIGIGSFGLLAPMLVPFREEKSPLEEIRRSPNQNNEMMVNRPDGEEKEKRQLLCAPMKRLRDYGINYSDSYIWRPNACPKSILTYIRHLKHFHESPIVKYAYNSISYLLFLAVFCYYLLFNFEVLTDDKPTIHWTEIFVIIMVTIMLIEEIRQFICQENRSLIGKLSNYFIRNAFFSFIRVTSYALFYVGLILRYIKSENGETFTAAKIVLAYDLEIWFLRSFAFLGIAQKMGPKLVMIRKMIIDLFFFTYIILIAMIAYGVTSRSMYTFTNTTISFDGRSIFRSIIYPTYYLMYGNIGGELTQLDANPDSADSIATHILLAFHMLFVNILLINLLIAMFSFTFQSVQNQADLVWRYERYSLIREYFDRPPLFPPLNLVSHVIELVKFILRHSLTGKSRKRHQIRAKTFKMIGSNCEVDKDWSEFESYATDRYIRSLLTNQPCSQAGLVPSPARLEQPSSSDSAINNATSASVDDQLTSIRKTLFDLRNNSDEMNRCMQWMMDAMDRVKMSKAPRPRLSLAPTTDETRQDPQ